VFCPKCGDPIEPNETFCNKCGNQLRTSPNVQQQNINVPTFNTNQTNNQSNFNNQYNINSQYPNNQYSNDNNKNQMKMISIGAGAGLGVLIIVLVCVLTFGKTNYYFSNETYDDNNEIINTSENNTTQKKSKYSTVIITDNTYSGMKISNNSDAIKLIAKDSTDQKSSCSSEIKAIEEQIIKDYGITAVNLCEMDVEFAKEVANVFEVIYKEYPSVRGYLTNLSLINASMQQGYIAAFMPVFNFATADSSSGYPWIIKTQVLLNTTYFLNPTRLEASVTDGSNSGHFPPNATMYSPVAHELGHYLSFLAMMRHYDVESILLIDNSNVDELYKLYDDFGKGDFSLAMIQEAYNNYKKDTNTTLTLDEWRATISSYAVAKDNSGNYIYDETIAEGFHDVYLNGDNAKDASKYVVDVLKKKLES